MCVCAIDWNPIQDRFLSHASYFCDKFGSTMTLSMIKLVIEDDEPMNEAHCQLVRVIFLCQVNVSFISRVPCSAYGMYILKVCNTAQAVQFGKKYISLSKLVAVLLDPTTTKCALLQVWCLVLFTTLPCWMVSLQIAKLLLLFLIKTTPPGFQKFILKILSDKTCTSLQESESKEKRHSLLFASPRPGVSTKPSVIASLCFLL